MKIAFFDFDGTLTHHDSFIGFAKFSVGRAALFKALAMSVPILCLWKLGLKNNSEAKQTLFSKLYRGMSHSEFKKLGISYISQIESDLRLDIIDMMHWHKRKGDRLVIVSASIGDWIRPWAETVGVDEVIATEAEVDNEGRLTGRFLTKNCHGEEKANRIRRAMPNVGECETWAYGDSSGDTDMLALVNHPNKV